MASQYPPVKGAAFTLFFSLYKNDGTIIANPGTYTKKVSIDGGAVADITADVTEEDTTYGQLSVVLSTSEMNGDAIWVYIVDNTTGCVPFTCTIYTAGALFDTLKAEAAEIKAAVITNAAGTDIAADIIALKAETATILEDTGTTIPGTITTLQGNVTDILTDTGTTLDTLIKDIPTVAEFEARSIAAADYATAASLATVAGYVDTEVAALITTIGVAGAGLTAVPWNASWDAEVQSECADALNAYDPPTNAEMEARTLVSAGYASPTNITAGTITTVTNLTNAPTVGDLTAAMKSSVNTEVAAALGTYDPPTKAELDTAVANVSVDEIQATALADLFNTDSATTYAAAVAGSVVKEIADNAGGSALTAAGIADAVWDEAIADHAGVGSTGAALAAAGGSGDPWSTALPGAYGAGTAGKIIGDNINAPIGTVDTVVDGIATTLGVAGAGLTALGDTRIANLDTTVSSRLAPAGTLAHVTLTDTCTTNTDMRGTNSAALASVCTEGRLAELDAANMPADVAAVKAKTDNLPASPAATGAQMDLVNAPNATAVAAIQNGLATPTNITAGTITTVTNLTNAPTVGDLTTAMKASVTAAVPTTAAIKTAIEAAGSLLDLLAKANVYKLIINETTGAAEMFDAAGTSLGTIAAAFTSAGGFTTRKKMVP